MTYLLFLLVMALGIVLGYVGFDRPDALVALVGGLITAAGWTGARIHRGG